MSKLAIVLTALVGFGALGCDDNDELDDNDIDEAIDEGEIPIGDDMEPVTPVAPATIEWRATLVDIDASTNITGESVVLQSEGEQSFNAAVSISNDSATCARPWHVHFGTCATGGAIVGNDADYPDLVVAADGTASATAVVGVGLDPAQAYHVNVHYSESQFDRIIACGDLVLTTVVVSP
jgi:hypothetical protein